MLKCAPIHRRPGWDGAARAVHQHRAVSWMQASQRGQYEQRKGTGGFLGSPKIQEKHANNSKLCQTLFTKIYTIAYNI